jgi:hypothetical protein
MGRRPRALPSCLSLLASLFIVACASTPHAFESRFTQEFFSSRDGKLRYRAPIGWLDATHDAPSSNSLIWLVRSDYAATLGVREVVIDAETRREVNRTDLGRVAELTLALASGEKGLTIVMQPVVSTLRGTKVCTYEYATGHPGDLVRIVLVDAGDEVYEVSMLMTSRVDEKRIPEAASLQEAFVQNVLW